MKTAGIVIVIIGILSFLGAALYGDSIVGPLFWIAVGAAFIHFAKQKEKGKENDQ